MQQNYVIQEHDLITRAARIITRTGAPMTREDAQTLLERLDAANTDPARSYTIGYARITAAMVDYLPVAVRAADRCPDSLALWLEVYHAHQAIIGTANRSLPEAQAAEVQALVGHLSRLAVTAPSAEAVAASQRAKGKLLCLAGV